MSATGKRKRQAAADRAAESLDRLIARTLEAAHEAKRTRAAMLRLARRARQTKSATQQKEDT